MWRWAIYVPLAVVVLVGCTLVLFNSGGPGNIGFLLMALGLVAAMLLDWRLPDWRPVGRR